MTKDGEKLHPIYSEREIPLVGVALEALKRAPKGFPHYRDRGDLLSQALLRAFKSRNLLPTTHHRIYSLRHSFEKRMLEGGLDYGLRCTLMGHISDRPEYGDGGSLKYRQSELLKIVYPVKTELLEGYPLPPSSWVFAAKAQSEWPGRLAKTTSNVMYSFILKLMTLFLTVGETLYHYISPRCGESSAPASLVIERLGQAPAQFRLCKTSKTERF